MDINQAADTQKLGRIVAGFARAARSQLGKRTQLAGHPCGILESAEPAAQLAGGRQESGYDNVVQCMLPGRCVCHRFHVEVRAEQAQARGYGVARGIDRQGRTEGAAVQGHGLGCWCVGLGWVPTETRCLYGGFPEANQEAEPLMRTIAR